MAGNCKIINYRDLIMKYYKISEVAGLFRVSRQYIWKLVKQNRIQSVIIDRIIRIPDLEVERMKRKLY